MKESGLTPGYPASVPEERGGYITADAAAESYARDDIKLMVGSQLRP